MSAPHPHCDDLVLHAPGTCEYCDHYPERQQARIASAVNFTGESVAGRSQCPAEARRSFANINAWGGNRAAAAKIK